MFAYNFYVCCVMISDDSAMYGKYHYFKYVPWCNRSIKKFTNHKYSVQI